MPRERPVFVGQDARNRRAGSTGAEDVSRRVAGLLLAGGQGDDLRGPAGASRPTADGRGLHAELDYEVDGRGELAGRKPLRDVWPGFHRASHELADRSDGIG